MSDYTRLSCVVCGVLGYWATRRSDVDLEIMKQAHQGRNAGHEVTWETGLKECQS